MKVSIADWDANQGDASYRQAVCDVLKLPLTSVSVSSDSLRPRMEEANAGRRMQAQTNAPQPAPIFGVSSPGVMVTVDVMAPAKQAVAMQQAARSGGIMNALRLLGGFWSNIQSQDVVVVGVDPTLQPTPAASLSRVPTLPPDNQQVLANGSLTATVGGMPLTTLIAVVIVIVVVLLAVAYVVVTKHGKKKPLSALESHAGNALANNNFQPHIASSRGSRGSRGSFQQYHSGAGIELDTYGVSGGRDDQSLASENPGFGSIRRSMDGRRSIDSRSPAYGGPRPSLTGTPKSANRLVYAR